MCTLVKPCVIRISALCTEKFPKRSKKVKKNPRFLPLIQSNPRVNGF